MANKRIHRKEKVDYKGTKRLLKKYVEQNKVN